MVGGTCEKWKNFKDGCHYIRHKVCVSVVCMNINLIVCVFLDIKHHESISSASIPAIFSENSNNKNNHQFKKKTYFQNEFSTMHENNV